MTTAERIKRRIVEIMKHTSIDSSNALIQAIAEELDKKQICNHSCPCSTRY